MNDHALGAIGTFDRGVRHLTVLDRALLQPGLLQHRLFAHGVLDHLSEGLMVMMIHHRRLCLGLAAVAAALVVPKIVPKDHLVVMVLHRDDRGAWH